MVSRSQTPPRLFPRSIQVGSGYARLLLLLYTLYLLHNPVHRRGEDTEGRHSFPISMATGIVTGPEERHSDCDDVSVEKKRATMSSKNPVYGQPTTEGAVGTPHNQVVNIIDMYRT